MLIKKSVRTHFADYNSWWKTTERQKENQPWPLTYTHRGTIKSLIILKYLSTNNLYCNKLQ